MAGKVVTTSAPSKQEAAAAKSYVGGAAKQFQGSAKVQEKVGSDASNVNHYRNISAYKATHPGSKFNNYEQTKYDKDIRSAVDRDREVGQLNEAYDYLNSGNTNRESTTQWIDMANERAQNAKDEDIRGEWAKLANHFNNQYQFDSYTARENNLAQIAELDKKIQDVTNKARSASDVVTYWDSQDGSKPSQERANYLNWQLKQLNFQKAALEQDNASIEENFYNVLATDEEKAAISALKEGKYGNIEKLNLGNALGKVFGKDNVVTGNGRDKNADLATAQAFYDRIGMQMPAYFNNRDAWGGKLEGTVQSIAGNYVSAAGLFDATAKDQADILLGNKEATGWDTALGILSGGHYALQGLVAKGRDKLLGAGQEQIGSLNRPEDGSIEALWDAYNNAKTPEDRAAIQEILNAGYTSWLKNIGTMQGRVYENSAWLENFSKATTAATGAEEIAALESEYREREAENRKLNKSIREARVIAEKYNGDSPSYWYALRDGTAEDRADALLQLGFKLDNEGKTKQQGAESTVGPIERRLMQAAGTALEIGADAAIAGITGAGPAASKFSMGLRVFGGTGKQAIDKGASISQATLYGYAKASAEIITEAMFDFAGGLVYGKSFTGDLAGELARRLSDNPAFRKWIIKGLNVFGEGAEEGASDILGIPIEMIIDYNKDQTFWQNLSRLSVQEMASFWEDMLMGSLVALLGMPLGDITGTYRGQVAETYAQDIAKDEAVQGKIEDEREARLANTAKIQGENFDPTAINKMMDEKAVEAMKGQSKATNIAQKLQVLKHKFDSGAEITQDDLLTKDEFNIAVAAGWVNRNARAQLSVSGGTRAATEEERAKAEYKAQKDIAGYVSRIKESVLTAFGQTKAKEESPEKAEQEEAKRKGDVSKAVKDAGKKGQKESEKMKKAHAKEKAKADVDKSGKIKADSKANENAPESSKKPGNKQTPPKKEKTVKPPVESKPEGTESKDSGEKKKAPAKNKKGDLKPSRLEQSIKNTEEHQKRIAEDKARQTQDNEKVKSAYTNYESVSFPIKYNGEDATATIDATVNKKNTGVITVKLPDGRTLKVKNPSLNKGENFTLSEARSWLYQHRKTIGDMPTDTADSEITEEAKLEEAEEAPDVDEETSEEETIEESGEPVDEETDGADIGEDNADEVGELDEDEEAALKEKESQQKAQDLAKKYAESGKEEDLKTLETFTKDMDYELEVKDDGIIVEGVEHKFSDSAKAKKVSTDVVNRTAVMTGKKPAPAPAPSKQKATTKTDSELVDEAIKAVGKKRGPGRTAAALVRWIVDNNRLTAKQVASMFSNQSGIKKLLVEQTNALFAGDENPRLLEAANLKEKVARALGDLGINVDGYESISERGKTEERKAEIAAKKEAFLKQLETELEKYYAGKENNNGVDGTRQESTSVKGEQNVSGGAESQSTSEPGVETENSKLTPRQRSEEAARKSLSGRGITDEGVNRLSRVLGAVKSGIGNIVESIKFTRALNTFEDIGKTKYTLVKVADDVMQDGVTDPNVGKDSFGVALFWNKASQGRLGFTAGHEAGHSRILAFEQLRSAATKTTVKYTAENIEKAIMGTLPIKERADAMKKITGTFMRGWAEEYLGDALTEEDFDTILGNEDKGIEQLSPEEVISTIESRLLDIDPDGGMLADFQRAIRIEYANELLVGRSDWFDLAGVKAPVFNRMAIEARKQLVKDGIFDNSSEVTNLVQAVLHLNKESELTPKSAPVKTFNDSVFKGEFGSTMADEAADQEAEKMLEKSAKDVSKFDPKKPVGLYSVRVPTEDGETKKEFVVIRNVSPENALRAFINGGEPAPSRAVVKIGAGHTFSGSVSFIYRKSSIDPEVDPRNRTWSGDTYSPLHPGVRDGGATGKLLEAWRGINDRLADFGVDTLPEYKLRRIFHESESIEDFKHDLSYHLKLAFLDDMGATRKDVGITLPEVLSAFQSFGGDRVFNGWLNAFLKDSDIEFHPRGTKILEDRDNDSSMLYTLDNALKVMQQQPWVSPAENSSPSELNPPLLTEFHSLEDLKKFTQRRTAFGHTGTLSGGGINTHEFWNFMYSFQDGVFKQARRTWIKEGVFDESDAEGYVKSVFDDWVAAIANKFTNGFDADEFEKIIKEPLYDEWGDEITLPVNDDLRLELKEYLRGVADIPVKFYENKSERVVGSDEIALVLVPFPDVHDSDYFDSPEYKLIEYLDEHNIPYQVYSDTPSSYKMDPLTGEILDESGGYKPRQEIIAQDLGEYVWSKRAPKAKIEAAETGNEVDLSKNISTPHGTKLSKRASDFWFARNVTPKGTKNTSTNKEFDKFNTLGEIHALGGHIDYDSVSDVEIGNVAAQNIEMGLKKYGYEAVVEAYKKADPSRTDDLESREIAALARMIDEELWFRMTHDWKPSNTSLASSNDILKADYQELSELAQKAANRAAKKLRRTTITTPELDALNNFKQTWAKRDTVDTLDPDSNAAHIIRFGQDTVAMIKDITQKRAENGYKNEAEAKKAMMDVLKEVNRIRNVQGIFDDSIFGKALGKGSRWAEDRLLDKVLKDSDFDTIKMMALGSLNRINSDFQNVMLANTVNQFRYMNMLSAFMTTMNNFLNNLESATTGAFANNLAYRFLNNRTKKILGEQTLTRSDNDWFKRINIFSETNKDLRRYMTTKGAESALSLLYGLDVDDGKIDLDLGAKHNQNSTVLGSNYLGSFMARYQLLTGLKMNTTDAMAMARAYRAQERNIDKLKVSNERKAVLKEAAWQEARRQMYHNEDNFVGKAILKAREGLDKYPIGGEGSSLGLGSILIPFVQVPVNVATRALEATPAGVVYDLAMGGIQLAKLQKQADNYRAAQQAREIKNNKEEWSKLTKEQRDAYEETLEKYGHLSMPTDIEVQKAARMIGHAGANAMSFAVGMLATFMGALRNFDDEDDKELQRLAKEKGYTGLQLNLSAMFNGGKWNDDGDIVIGGGWLEVLAIPLAAGYAVMQSMKGKDSSTDKLKALMKAPATTFKQAIDVVASMPGVDQFYDIWNSYQNLVKYTPDQEERIEKEGNAALQYTASTLASFVIPNAVATTTAGLDNTVREIYNEDTVGKVMGNIFKSKIPGLRQTLRPAIDSTGHVRTYGSNPFMGWLNKAILPGTGIKNWKLDELEKEYVRLKEAGVTGELMPRKSAPNYVDVEGERFTYNTEEKRTWDDLNTSLVTAGQQILMNTKGYQEMTDAEKGAAMRDVKTLMALVSHQTILDTKEAGVNVELKGWENAYFGNKEDGPDMEGLASYLIAKHTFKPIWDVKNNTFRDFKAADDFITNVYDKLDDTAKETLNSSYAWLDKFSKAKKEAGITAEEFAYIKELQDKYEDAQEAMKDLPDDDSRREGTVALNRNMDVEFEDYFGGRNKKSQWAQSNVKLGNWIPASTETMEKWQSKTSLLTREIDSWQDQKASTPVLGGYKELSQNQRFQMIRDFNGITASNQQDLEKKRWDMIEQEASKGEDKDGDGEGDGGAWAKLKPFRDAGYSVAYALDHAVYWYTKDYGKHWQKRSYNKIYPPD